MVGKAMSEIVCATRGGEGSRVVQLAAIKRAKATGEPLVFLYVASPSSIRDVKPALETAVRDELMWFGKALLFVAEKRARDAGLEVEIVVREGLVVDEISNYLVTNKVSNLLLGAPRGTTSEVFGDDPVERFAADIHHSTGVEVNIIRPEHDSV